MIVPMKKVTLLVSNKGRQKALNTLRRLGVVHIRHVQVPSGGPIGELEEKIEVIARAQNFLGPVRGNGTEKDLPEKKDAFVEEIVSFEKERQALESNIHELKGHLDWYDLWGDISAEDIRTLGEAGVSVKLYVCPKKDVKNIDHSRLVIPVKEKGSTVYAALLSQETKEKLPFSEIEVPHKKRQEVEEELAISRTRRDFLVKELTRRADYSAALSGYRRQVEKELEFSRVRAGMGDAAEFSYVTGFCPSPYRAILIDCAQAEQWAYVIETPDDPGEVPTLIKNPRWIEIIKPVFQFMGTVPGYKEFDISVWFLFFFSLFFAMLIGDAGYGLLFLGVTLYVKKKVPSLGFEPFLLLIVLSVSTFIWGTLTGTWFGFEQIAQLPGLRQLVIPKISSFSGSPDFLMHLCFFIGAVQLSIAHVMRVVRYFPDLRSLAQAGWVQITWGIFFIAGNLVLGKEFPGFARYLLMTGIGLVILFSYPQKNMLKGILMSVANLPLSVISSFADTLSYLRLFAVGFASVMVAVSFNEMALGVGFNGIISSFFAALILFLGHALNIILGLMSVLVHGIRLNMLEFSGHLDMEWAGREYEPFKE